jgi:hypothetical protein
MTRQPSIPVWLAAVLCGLNYLLWKLGIGSTFPENWAGSPDRQLGMSLAGWSGLLCIPTALLLIEYSELYHHVYQALDKLG